MNKSVMNIKNVQYEIKKSYEEIYDNLKVAINHIEFGDDEEALTILKAVCKEVGGE